MTIRQKIGLALMTRGQIAIGKFSAWIMGGITSEVMRAYIEKQKPYIDALPQNAIKLGMAREGSDMNATFQKFAASIRPDSQWCFNKTEHGKLVIMLMPRVIDSNTALVMESEEPDIKPGDIITLDGNPPNCDPAALHQFTAPPPSLQEVDAEFCADMTRGPVHPPARPPAHTTNEEAPERI